MFFYCNKPYLSQRRKTFASEERSVPYIKKPDAEHNGNFKTEHYFDIIDSIIKGDLEALNSIRQKQGKSKLDTTDLIYYQEVHKHYTEWVKSEGILINATYGLQGYAAPWKINGKIALKGGAPQFTTPFTAEVLKDLGLLEIKK